MFLTVSIDVIIAWSWLLYLCMPLRPTRCSDGYFSLELGADRLDVALVALVVDRIGLLLAHDAAVDDSSSRARPILASSLRPSAISSSSGESHSPSPSKQKYSRPRQASFSSGTISGDQERKFWMRPTLTLGSWM